MDSTGSIHDLTNIIDSIIRYRDKYESNSQTVNEKHVKMLNSWVNRLSDINESVNSFTRYETFKQIDTDIEKMVKKDSEIGVAIIYVPINVGKQTALFDYRIKR